MSNGTTSHQANQCKMVSWKALTAACGTSASTSTCSPTSKRHARSSKHGGSTTTPTDRTRASMGSHQLSSQHAPIRGITGTDSPYERGQLGEQVISIPPPPASNQSEQRIKPIRRGSILDADPLAQGVNFARRITAFGQI